MKSSALHCQDDQRRYQVRSQHRLGFDYLDVRQSQKILCVHFIGQIPKQLVPERLRKEHLLIEGGQRIQDIQIVDVRVERPDDNTLDACLKIELDRPGDFSQYTLKAVALDAKNQPTDAPHPDFDPHYAQLTFRFHGSCPTGLDCLPEISCPVEAPPPEPDIDYLAKDYASFRRLVLDRLALLVPDWQSPAFPEQKEPPIPDLGIALVELLAYVGDHLSYYQDAVATEAYLDTARQRISVRRHSCLVDYAMHEGCNARTWINLATSDDAMLDLETFYFVTRFPEAPYPGPILHHTDLDHIPKHQYEVFEPLRDNRPTPTHLEPNDFKDWDRFVAKLQMAADKVSEYLRSQLSAGSQQLLAAALDQTPLNECLKRLADWLFTRTGDTFQFKADDCVSWRVFFKKLCSLSTQISLELRRLSPDRVKFLLQVIADFSNPKVALKQAIIDDLNCLIQRESLYDTTRFLNVNLSARTQQALQSPSSRDELARLNRWLLEDVYRHEIRQTQYYVYQAHNTLYFYTWGNRQCCLPKGATSATLKDEWIPIADTNNTKAAEPEQLNVKTVDDLRTMVEQAVQQAMQTTKTPTKPLPLSLQHRRKLHLQVGDVLIFQEVKSPTTGQPTDADPTHCHAVRLTRVELLVDDLYVDTKTKLPRPLAAIEWAPEDALPFPLCISSLGSAEQGCLLLDNISIAKGNVVLADHGRTLFPPIDILAANPTRTIDLTDHFEPVGCVAAKQSIRSCEGERQPSLVTIIPQVFKTKLQHHPLTFSQPVSVDQWQTAPAAQMLLQDPRQALPQIKTLLSVPPGIGAATPKYSKTWAVFDVLGFPQWTPQPDLFNSQSTDQHVVVEMDNERTAYLRFGDGHLGQQPMANSCFWVNYRIGGGSQGNIGAHTIRYVISRQQRFNGLHIVADNPLPAQGGTPSEPLSEVKLFAPHRFRQQLQRAITAQDYADIVMRDFKPQVQRAKATLTWTGSWYEVAIAIDPRGSESVDLSLLETIADHLYRYRRMGHEVSVRAAVYVPLSIALQVCIEPNFLKTQVKAALMAAFSNKVLLDGQRGFFHPDNFTFGQGVSLSQLVAVGQAISGVRNLQVICLERLTDVISPQTFPTEKPNDKTPASNTMLSGYLSINPFEIIRLDNDPNNPENGLLLIKLEGGR